MNYKFLSRFRLFFILFILFFFKRIEAQESGGVILSGPNGDIGSSIIQISNGNYYLLSTHGSISQGNEIALTKLNSRLEYQWTKNYGTQFEDGSGDLIQLHDGNFLLCGRNQNGGILIKTDPEGNVLNSVQFANTPVKVVESSSGSIYVASYIRYCTTNLFVAILHKFDKSLNLTSSKLFTQQPCYDYVIASFFINEEGFLILGGRTGAYGYIIEVDTSLIIRRSKQFEFNTGTGTTYSTGILELKNHQYNIVGGTSTFNNFGNLFILKIDSSWNILKSTLISYSSALTSSSFKCIMDNDSNIAAVLTSGAYGIPSTGSNVELMKLNRNGDIIWFESFGSYLSDDVYDISLCNDGGYICTGSTSGCSLNIEDIFLLKVDKNGINDCIQYLPLGLNYDSTFIEYSINVNTIDTLIQSTPIVLNNYFDDYLPSNLCSRILLEEKNTIVIDNPYIDAAVIQIRYVVPNPLCPTFLHNEAIRLRIFNMLGQLVENVNVTEWVNYFGDRIEIPLNKAGLSSGMYVWALFNKYDVNISRGKFEVMK